MEKWLVSMKKADFKKIASLFHIDPVTARLIRNRDYTELDDINKFLNGSKKDLYSPLKMKDMEKAADLLLQKINEKKSIRIIGDYDIDGVMSTYILLRGLSRLGADVDERIPERIKDGYGLNESLVQAAYEDKKDTILTCDNGIAAYSQIELARQLGLTVIVTDHHEVPFDPETLEQILPPANAVVDPKQSSCSYPFKELCGASIAWKLIELLYQKCGIPMSEWEDLMKFAAIATIGDVCDLRDENRIIVKEGLASLAHSEHCGLNALIRLNNLDPAAISAYHVGFVLGPCLNASGRLDTAQKALALMNAQTDAEALSLASELFNLNVSRKSLTEEYTQKAIELVEGSQQKKDPVLVVYLPDCHESIAGIIAGRLREKYHKPAFVLTDSGTEVKGSGRSIDEFSMFQEMNKCKDLFTKFGGHPLAAGLSLPRENVPLFQNRINAGCTLTEDDLLPKIHIDMPMPISYIRKDLVADIDKLKPFGKGNQKPLFAQRDLLVLHPTVVGKNKNVLRMQLTDENGFYIDGIYFGDALEFFEYLKSHPKISIVYYPSINEFRGSSTLQVVITNYR